MTYDLSSRLRQIIHFTKESLSVTTSFDEVMSIAPFVAAASMASLIPVSRYNTFATIWGLVRYASQPDRRRYSRKAQQLVSRGMSSNFDVEIKNILAFKSYVKFWIENLAHLVAGPAQSGRDLTTEGDEPLKEWLAQGRGAIVATSHAGNPDWAGTAIANQVHPLAAIFGPLDPPVFERWSHKFRTSLGLETIFLQDGAVTKQIISKIGEGKLVALTCDFNISGNAIDVDFFSKKVPMASGPATIALRTGAPIFPGIGFMKSDGGHHLFFGPPIFPKEVQGDSVSSKVLNITQTIAKELERQISMAPEQWHVVVPLDIKD